MFLWFSGCESAKTIRKWPNILTMKPRVRALILCVTVIFGMFFVSTAEAKGSIEVLGRVSDRQAYTHFVGVRRGSLVDVQMRVMVDEFDALVNLLFMYNGTAIRAISALVGVNTLFLSTVPHSYLFASPTTIAILLNGKPFTPKRTLEQLFRQGLILPSSKGKINSYLINLKVRVK